MISLLPLQHISSNRYILDANIFIASWRDYYPIDIYPGFWDCLQGYAQQGTLLSIDKVYDEIKGPPGLISWIKEGDWGRTFASTESHEVSMAFSHLERWVYNSQQFKPAVKHEFAGIADGWIAAYALVNGYILVTNEVYSSDVKRRVPLPNLCREFGIAHCNTIKMLRNLGVKFDLRYPAQSATKNWRQQKK